MSRNSYSHFPRGHQSYGNPIKSQNSHGELTHAFSKDNYKNSRIEVLWSGRRNIERFSLASKFELKLSRVYKNVSSIELLGLRVPICDTVVARGEFYLFLWADGRLLELVSLGDTTQNNLEPNERDSFSLDGAFAHVFVDGDPTILHPYQHYRRIFRFHQPLGKLSKLRVELRMYPANSQKKPWALVPFMHSENCIHGGNEEPNSVFTDICDEVTLSLEINSQI